MPITQINNLLTTHTFNGQDYLIKLNVMFNNIELTITDKQIGEEWQCSYDQTYIENLTFKTGNFKKFDIFSTMLKSGLLKTSRAISLDLLTFDDLQYLREKMHKRTNNINQDMENRRYFILIYSVEFDKIVYPLPLEYCGPPDVAQLIATIRRLENELAKNKEEISDTRCDDISCYEDESKLKTNCQELREMRERMKELLMENNNLKEEIRNLQMLSFNQQKNNAKSKNSSSHVSRINARNDKASALEQAILKLEHSVVTERNSHQKLIEKMRVEKQKMQQEIDELRRSERVLKQQLNPKRAQASKSKSSGISSLSGKTSGKVLERANSAPSAKKTTPTSSRSLMETNRSRFTFSSPLPTPKTNLANRSRSPSPCASVNSRISCNSKRSLNRSPRPCSKPPTPRSPSTNSCSSHARSDKIQLRLKTSENEYKTIENRINDLQKLLRDSNQH